MKDLLNDIVKHTANLGFFEFIRIDPTGEDLKISSADSETTIILNAKAKKKVKDLDDVIGLGSLSFLKRVMSIMGHADVKLIKEERNGTKFISGIEFNDKNNKSRTVYRFVHKSMIPEMPAFKGTNWDITFKPTKSRIEYFTQLATLNAEMDEQHFTPKLDKGDLFFYIGEENSSSNRTEFVFADGIKGTYTGNLRWPVAQTLQTLRLAQSGDASVSLSNKGVMRISIDSGLVEYDFYIVAAQKG